MVFSCGLKLVIDYVVDKCNLQRAHPFRFPPQTCRGSDWAFEHSGLISIRDWVLSLRSQRRASVFPLAHQADERRLRQLRFSPYEVSRSV